MKLLTAVLCTALFCFNAMAEQRQHNLDLGVGASIPLSTSAVKETYDSGLGLGFNYRYKILDKLSVGLGYVLLDFDEKNAHHHALSFLGRYDFSTSKTRPFAQVGLGYAQVKESTTKYEKPAALIGIGVDHSLNDKFALYLVANLHHIKENTTNRSQRNILAPLIGLTYKFGSDSASANAPQNIVKKEISKAKAAVIAMINDADKDGVKDESDQCPNTPAGKQVNVFGCQPDEEVKINLNVKFASSKAIIQEDYTQDIDKLGEVMTSNKEIKVEIQGHTDSSGSEKYNVYISQKRAEAVRVYLIGKFGIDSDRISAKGYGPKFPIASNATSEGKKKNRRCEAKILN